MFSVDVFDNDGDLVYTSVADTKESAESKLRFFSGWRSVSRVIVSLYDPVRKTSSKLAVFDSDRITDLTEIPLPPGVIGGIPRVQGTLDSY